MLVRHLGRACQIFGKYCDVRFVAIHVDPKQGEVVLTGVPVTQIQLNEEDFNTLKDMGWYLDPDTAEWRCWTGVRKLWTSKGKVVLKDGRLQVEKGSESVLGNDAE